MSNMQTNQTPEALAEEILCLSANGMDWTEELMRLRDMAASGAKDAERYQMVRRGQRWSVINGIGDELKGEALDAAADAAIAATKRG